MPGSQPVGLAVSVPGVSQSTIGDHGSESLVLNDIGPRRGSPHPRPEIDHILACIFGGAPESVEMDKADLLQGNRFKLLIA